MEEVSEKTKCGRSRKKWSNQIKDILKEDSVRSTRNRRACVKSSMRVIEAKEIRQERDFCGLEIVRGYR